MTEVQLGRGHSLAKPAVVCLGFFDGVHIGHQKLVSQGVDIARRQGLLSCVHTFSQMPARVLSANPDILELTPFPEKAKLLAALGVDVVAVSPFDDATIHMRAEAFFYGILLDRLRAKHVVAGADHRFGYRGEGDADMLRALGGKAGIGLSIVHPVTMADGEVVSSTAVRKYLLAGNRARAEEMLGRRVEP